MALLVVVGVLSLAVNVQASWYGGVRVGFDLQIYSDAAAVWLNGGPFYREWQLAGPYELPHLDFTSEQPVLYPPPTLLLFLPWAIAPFLAPLWWLIPLGAIAWCIWSWQPVWSALVVVALLALMGQTTWLVISGNPVMWASAALALGLCFGWPAVLVLIKPTLAPFALVGAHRKSWWAAAALSLAISALFLPMWPDYFSVLRNVGEQTPGYLVNNVPIMLIPLVAYFGRAERWQSMSGAAGGGISPRQEARRG